MAKKILYEITADYSVVKRMIVRVPKGADPMDPNSWSDIIDEHDVDCTLVEVHEAEECENT